MASELTAKQKWEAIKAQWPWAIPAIDEVGDHHIMNGPSISVVLGSGSDSELALDNAYSCLPSKPAPEPTSGMDHKTSVDITNSYAYVASCKCGWSKEFPSPAISAYDRAYCAVIKHVHAVGGALTKREMLELDKFPEDSAPDRLSGGGASGNKPWSDYMRDHGAEDYAAGRQETYENVKKERDFLRLQIEVYKCKLVGRGASDEEMGDENWVYEYTGDHLAVSVPSKHDPLWSVAWSNGERIGEGASQPLMWADARRRLTPEAAGHESEIPPEHSFPGVPEVAAAEPASVERELRLELWLNHGHIGVYGDDGEMQCSACGPKFWDFRRTPILELVGHVKMLRMQKYSASSAPALKAQGGCITYNAVYGTAREGAHPELGVVYVRESAPDLASLAKKLASALELVLNSACPNPRDHPTMTKAWPVGESVLAEAEAKLKSLEVEPWWLP